MTVLCVATYLKGEAFIQECHRLGALVVLLTADRLVDAAWPREAIAEIQTIPRDAADLVARRAVDAIARRRRIDRIVALDDFDVELAAMLREHLQVWGFGRTIAARFRDKLMMRTNASRLGLRVPEFVATFNDREIEEWAGRVAPPWVLKPRSSAAATGIRKVGGLDELRRALEGTGDDRSQYVLEQFVSGNVYHVDSIVAGGQVVFQVVCEYGRPPMEVAHEGGIFVTRLVPDEFPEAQALTAANRRLLAGFELADGVSHTEFIWADGQPVFLETSARVGGAYIADVIEAATGVNLWREWAAVSMAGPESSYRVPQPRRDFAGIVLSLARQPAPDMSAYVDPEIVRVIRKHHHAGLIVASPDRTRIETLLQDYVQRFTRDFLATMPAPDRPAE